jgi:Rrf2 family protein
LYCLTREYEPWRVSGAAIADQERILRKFLEAILPQARHAGLVDSRQGNGEYYLSLPPGSITIGSVIHAIDGPLAPLPCVGESACRSCAECVDETRCETRAVMKQVRDASRGSAGRRNALGSDEAIGRGGGARDIRHMSQERYVRAALILPGLTGWTHIPDTSCSKKRSTREMESSSSWGNTLWGNTFAIRS